MDFTLGTPGFVTHEWFYADGEGPLTVSLEGHPMRVDTIKIVLDGEGNGVDISVTGMRTRADGQRDRRYSYRTSEGYDGWVTQEAAAQFAATRKAGA